MWKMPLLGKLFFIVGFLSICTIFKLCCQSSHLSIVDILCLLFLVSYILISSIYSKYMLTHFYFFFSFFFVKMIFRDRPSFWVQQSSSHVAMTKLCLYGTAILVRSVLSVLIIFFVNGFS